jgi:hypothetical protein
MRSDDIRCRLAAKALHASPDVTEVFFADRDMRPDEQTDPILTANGDVVGCRYPGRRGPAEARWSDPTAIHMGLVTATCRLPQGSRLRC